MKNKRFITLFISGLTLLSLSLTGCDFLNNLINKKDDEEEKEKPNKPDKPDTPEIPEEQPTIHIVTDDILTYDASKNRYDATIVRGESYTINCNLGDYSGNDYYMVLSVALDNNNAISLNGFTVSANSEPNDNASVALALSLKQKSKPNNSFPTTFLYFQIKKYEPKVDYVIDVDDKMSFEYDKYRLKLVPGDSYQIHARAEGLSDYTIDYHHSSDYFYSISESGLITAKNRMDFVGYHFTQYLYFKQGENTIKYLSIDIYFVDNYTDKIANDVDKPAGSPEVELKENTTRITLEDGQTANDSRVKYVMKYPYQGVYYSFPDISLKNYDGEFHTKFIPIYDCDISFETTVNEILFKEKEDASNVSRPIFKVYTYDEEGKEIASIYVKGIKTRVGPGEFTVKYGKDQKLLSEGDEIQIQKDLEYPLKLYFNGLETSLSKVSIESSDSTLVAFGYKSYIKGNKVGQTNVTIKLNDVKDSEGTLFTYALNIKVQVIDEAKPIGIYVPSGERAFVIKDNSVSINGVIYAIFEGDIYRKINGSENLDVTLSDTDNENVKRVTVIYSDKGVSVSKFFDIDVSDDNSFYKTALNQNFETFYNEQHRYTKNAIQNHGNLKLLAIPIWFINSDEFINENLCDANGLNQKEQIIEDTKTILTGDDLDIGWTSLKHFYEEESGGLLTIDATVSDWFNDNHSSKYYENLNYNTKKDLCVRAVDWFFTNHPEENFADYDLDNNGCVDTLIICLGCNYFGSNDWYRATCNYSAAANRVQTFIWIPATETYDLDGVKDTSVQLSTNDLSTLTVVLSSNTMIHEMGHAFGAVDLYDETSVGKALNDPTRNSPAGYFSMQDGNFGGHDPAQMMMYGWANPYVFDSSNTPSGQEFEITISDFQDTKDAIVLTNNWTSEDELFSEYLVLDLYTPTGLNAFGANKYSYYGVNATGIRLYHVNASKDETYKYFAYDNDTKSSNDYDFIHYIRKNPTTPYKTNVMAGENTFFMTGDTFDMDTYKSQFYKADGKLDNGTELGWRFEIKNIVSDAFGNAQATIKITRV